MFLKYDLSCCWLTVQYCVALSIAKMLSEKSEWHDFFSEKEVEVNKQWREQIDHFAWKVETEACKKAGLVIM